VNTLATTVGGVATVAITTGGSTMQGKGVGLSRALLQDIVTGSGDDTGVDDIDVTDSTVAMY
jgi:hypothetical protein